MTIDGQEIYKEENEGVSLDRTLLMQQIQFQSLNEYKVIEKMVKTQGKEFDGDLKVLDAITNPLQQVGFATQDPSFTTLGQTSNRGASWNTVNSDKAMRDVPYFINSANWKATLALRNGIDINSDDKKLDAKKINRLQREVIKHNQQLYNLIYEGEIYGFCGGLLVVREQNGVDEWEKPLEYDKIKKGDFLGIKLLTRLYSIVPDTTELLGIDDLEDFPYWAKADLIGKPKYYRVTIDQSNAITNGFRVHASKIVTYNTNPLSYVESKIELNMGVSMFERVYSEMARHETLMGQTIKMAQRSNIPVLKTDDTTMTMTTLNSDSALVRLLTSISLLKKALTNSNMISIGQDDSFEFANSSFQDVPQIVEKVESHLASALEVPKSVALGSKPEVDEEKSFEWVINKIFNFNLRDIYNRLIPILYANKFGEQIPDFDFEFKGVFLPTQKEKAETFKSTSTIITELYDRNIIDVQEARSMFLVSQTNISDMGNEFSERYNKYLDGSKIIDETIKNKINHDIALAKITNTGGPDPRTEQGKDKGGNPVKTKKPTPTIIPEKE